MLVSTGIMLELSALIRMRSDVSWKKRKKSRENAQRVSSACEANVQVAKKSVFATSTRGQGRCCSRQSSAAMRGGYPLPRVGLPL